MLSTQTEDLPKFITKVDTVEAQTELDFLSELKNIVEDSWRRRPSQISGSISELILFIFKQDGRRGPQTIQPQHDQENQSRERII